MQGLLEKALAKKKGQIAHTNFQERDKLPKTFFQAYDDFMAYRRQTVGFTIDIYWKLKFKIRYFLFATFLIKKDRMVKYNGMQQYFSFVINRPVLLKWYNAFTFQWSFESLKSRYGIKQSVSEGEKQ